jgi:DNA repair protein RadD
VITPHPHQELMLNEARAALKEHQAVLLQSPTGSGKTVIGTLIAQGAHAKGRRSMFTVHRDFLIEQTSEMFRHAALPHGIVAAGFTGDMNSRAQIASIDTLKHRLENVRRPDLLIVDECHHSLAAGWLKIIRAFMDQGTKVIGLTATPWRMSGQGLGQVFTHMVRGPSVAWLIENGFLSPYDAYAPFTPELAGVHSRQGDYINSELEAAVDKPTLTGDAIAHYNRLAPGKRAVAFCVSVAHSQHVSAAFNEAGIPAAHLDSDTPKNDRKRTIAAFRRGALQVLSSVDIFGEGFDIPSVEAAILLRPTKSLSLHLQQVGRALRVCSGKERAVLLDHAGNLMRLGLPDTEVEWTLADIEKKKKGEAASVAVRQCVQCYGVFPPGPICPYCGCVQPVASREIEQVDGQLQKITPEMKKALAKKNKIEVLRAETLEDLQKIAEERGYKPDWARHVFGAKERGREARAKAQERAYHR